MVHEVGFAKLRERGIELVAGFRQLGPPQFICATCSGPDLADFVAKVAREWRLEQPRSRCRLVLLSLTPLEAAAF